MAGAVAGAAKGAAAGATVGSVVPIVGNAVGAVGGAIIGFLGGIFKSKKHYNMYSWNSQNYCWDYVMQGHPDQIRAASKSYSAAGIATTAVRYNAAAPTTPPAGAVKPAEAGSSALPWILAGIAGLGLLAFFLLRHRR